MALNQLAGLWLEQSHGNAWEAPAMLERLTRAAATYRAANDTAAAARVQITALTWRASKQAPKRSAKCSLR